MNYEALTLEEVARFATTDVTARQWLAEHAAEILLDLLDDEDYWDVEAAYEKGEDDALQALGECYGDELVEAIDQHEDDDDLHRLLVALADSFAGRVDLATGEPRP